MSLEKKEIKDEEEGQGQSHEQNEVGKEVANIKSHLQALIIRLEHVERSTKQIMFLLNQYCTYFDAGHYKVTDIGILKVVFCNCLSIKPIFGISC